MSAQPNDPRPEPTPLPAEWVDRIDAVVGRSELGGAGEPPAGEAAQAGSIDDGARAALIRARRHAAVLRSLPRHVAPAALDGAVVAALNDGHRQDRAVRAVAGLAPTPAPAALDRAIEALIGGGTLDGAAEDGKGLRAPAALDGLVAEAIATDEEVDRAVRSEERLVVRRRATVGAGFALAVFAGVLVFGFGRGARSQGGQGATAQPSTFVQIVPVTLDSLTPAEREFLRSFGGPLYGGAS